MAADDLATKGAEASATEVLKYVSRNIPFSASEGLNMLSVDSQCVQVRCW